MRPSVPRPEVNIEFRWLQGMHKIWFSLIAGLIPAAFVGLAQLGPVVTEALTPVLAMIVAAIVMIGMHTVVRPAGQA